MALKAKSPATAPNPTPLEEKGSVLELRELRLKELDAEFKKQTRRLARMVDRLKHVKPHLPQ